MKPLIIEITDEGITIDVLRDCVEKAYAAGYNDGKNDAREYAFPSYPYSNGNVICTPTDINLKGEA